jgi:hypothetical protein
MPMSTTQWSDEILTHIAAEVIPGDSPEEVVTVATRPEGLVRVSVSPTILGLSSVHLKRLQS